MLAPAKYKADATEPLVKTNDTKPISKVTTVLNPDQQDFSSAWGLEHPVEFDIDLLTSEIQPSEDVGWLKLKHGLRLSISFVDPTVKKLVVVAPLQICRLLDEMWSLQSCDTDGKPPGYGVDDDHSTLLDSNTSRMTRSELHHELYPEREAPVPDVGDNLPPVYEHEGDQPVPYSEK